MKEFRGDTPDEVVALPQIHHGRVIQEPAAIRRARLNRGRWELLIQWNGQLASEASWEFLTNFSEQYPDFQLEDELFPREGGNVVDSFVGRTYQRRNKDSRATTEEVQAGL